MSFIGENNGVNELSDNLILYNHNDIQAIGWEEVAQLKDFVTKNPGKNARLCLHKTLQDTLHQMVIVSQKGVYVRPHKHIRKVESFQLIEGSFMIIIFNDRGKVIQVEKLERGNHFIFRIEKDIWHTVMPLSDLIVFQEITTGPFNGLDDSIYPDWAPDKENEVEVANYMKLLKEEVSHVS